MKRMKEFSCCFTGHRVISSKDIAELMTNLELEIENLIHKGVTNFICGGALGFDTVCASMIISMKQMGYNIKLHMAIPCKGQEENWHYNQIKLYNEIIAEADKVDYLQQAYSDGCMLKRNMYIVDKSSYCISYLRRSWGGTKKTVEYATKKGLKLIKL